MVARSPRANKRALTVCYAHLVKGLPAVVELLELGDSGAALDELRELLVEAPSSGP
jgi:hypothetical protein